MERTNGFGIICDYTSPKISQALRKVSETICSVVDEVRIRFGRPVSFVMAGKCVFLDQSGQVTLDPNGSTLVTADASDIDSIFMKICKYSVYSSSVELQQGWFTIRGGVRVGVAGVYNQAERILQHATSFNFRVAREIVGCGADIYNQVLAAENSVIICGKTNSGKTTILRDLCRICGNHNKVTLIDERRELAGMTDRSLSLDIGAMTDVISCLDRGEAIISAIRTLSPTYIFCDEISTRSDSDAILSGHGCGVKFVATAHAENMSDLMQREFIRQLIEMNVFDYAVFLFDERMPGQLSTIRRLKKCGS